MNPPVQKQHSQSLRSGQDETEGLVFGVVLWAKRMGLYTQHHFTRVAGKASSPNVAVMIQAALNPSEEKFARHFLPDKVLLEEMEAKS